MVNRYRILLVIFFLSVPFIPHNNKASAGVPSVSEIRVADVTTRSFSVIWIASEPSTASLLVYNAPDCNILVNGINVIGEGNDITGVIKASVTGLAPVTTYCFQTVTTSKNTLEPTITPSTPQIVTTESQTVRTYSQNNNLLPFSNDLLYHEVYGSDQTPGNGDTLLASVDGGSYPVSAWVGDGFPTAGTPGSLIDLNNLFGVSTRENMNLLGGERINLTEVRGNDGCTLERWRKVPADTGLTEVKAVDLCFDPADIDCNDFVDIGDIILDINGFGTTAGAYCFNADLDQDGNDYVDIGDIILVIIKFGFTK